jgi:hypothetical protein
MEAFLGLLSKYQLFKNSLLNVSKKRDGLSVCLSYSSQSLLVLAGNSLRVVGCRIVAAYLRRLQRYLPDKVGSNACRDQLMSLIFLRKYEEPPPPPTSHRTHSSPITNLC